MTITIEGSEYKLPASLSDITLQDRIDYDRIYGKGFRDKLIENADIENEVAQKSVSFFGKIPLEIIEATDLEEVLIIYREVIEPLIGEIDYGAEITVQREFEWKGERWELSQPELKQDSLMTFGEFIDAKQSVQNLGEERWCALLPLCCIYLRKKGESYDKNFVIEGGQRMEVMKTLPLSIALHVGFFFLRSMNMSQSISLCSGHRRQSQEVSI